MTVKNEKSGAQELKYPRIQEWKRPVDYSIVKEQEGKKNAPSYMARMCTIHAKMVPRPQEVF
jgi:hypothetical protein